MISKIKRYGIIPKREVDIMFVALNKNKKRVHISNVLDKETYYCPICGEELRTRQGTTNAHHFDIKTIVTVQKKMDGIMICLTGTMIGKINFQ